MQQAVNQPRSAVLDASPVPPATEAAPKRRFQLETFASLKYRDYRYLWIGTCILSAGQWIQNVTVGWLLYDLTGSSLLLGLLNGMRALPFLLIGPMAGVIADRMDRRMLMIQVQWVLAFTALAMGVLVTGGWVQPWHVFVFAAITGVGWTLIQPVRQALVPSVVPKQDLANAVALTSAGFNANKILGPVFGGMLIASMGAGGNFFFQAAAYAGVVAMVYMMSLRTEVANTKRASAWADLKEGVGYVWSNPMILALMTTSLVPNLLAFPLQTLMPVFQKDVLHVSPFELGLMLGAPGIGAVTSTLVLASFGSRLQRKGWVMLIALALWGVLMIAFAATTDLMWALVTLVGIGACQMAFMANNNTILQMTVPNELRGRVMSLYMLVQGITPAGALFAGALTAGIGAPSTVMVMGALCSVLGLLAGWRTPLLRQWTERAAVANN